MADMRPILIKGRENKEGGHYWNKIGNAWVDEDKITLNFFAPTILSEKTHVIIGLKDRENGGS